MEQPEPCEMDAGLFQRSVEKRACSTPASGCRASCDPSGWRRELLGSGSSLQPLGEGKTCGTDDVGAIVTRASAAGLSHMERKAGLMTLKPQRNAVVSVGVDLPMSDSGRSSTISVEERTL